MAEMAETPEMAEIEEKTSCSPYLLLGSVSFRWLSRTSLPSQGFIYWGVQGGS